MIACMLLFVHGYVVVVVVLYVGCCKLGLDPKCAVLYVELKDVRLHPSDRGVRLLDAAHAQMHAHGASERAWQVSSRASVTAASE